MSEQSIIRVAPSDLRLILDMVKSEIKRELNCHAIGTVITFYQTSGTVDVSFNYKKVLKQRNAVNTNEYTDVIIDYPMLIKCPVIILNGGGAYTTYPIIPGDTCLLMFCDRDIDIWLEKGSTLNPPNSGRMHDLSDAIALIGIYSTAKPIPNYSTTSVKTVFGRVASEFTNLVASIIDRHGERLVPVGTGPISTFATTPPNGWLFMYGQTLGKSGSGATEASDDYEDLFNILKNVYPNSGGTFSSGTIIIPDCRGRVPVFKNNIGGSDSSVLTTTYTPNRDILGGQVGEESHKLTVLELAKHYHINEFGNNTAGGGRHIATSNPNNTYEFNDPTDTEGGDIPHNNVQPGIVTNAMIKY